MSEQSITAKYRDQYGDDLSGFINFVRGITEMLFNENGGVSAFIVAEMKGRSDPLVIQLDSAAPVLPQLAELQPMLEEKGVDRAAKISEVWVSRFTKGNVPVNPQRPSLDPDREELVQIVARDRCGKGVRAMAVINRPANGPPHLGSWDESWPVDVGPLLGIRLTQ